MAKAKIYLQTKIHQAKAWCKKVSLDKEMFCAPKYKIV